MAGFFAFFLFYNRIGILNRLMFCLFASQGLVYFAKSNFYRTCVDELTYEMTLTGQEARILTMFHFPEHPQINLYEDLHKKYLEHSKSQAEREKMRRALLVKNYDK